MQCSAQGTPHTVGTSYSLSPPYTQLLDQVSRKPTEEDFIDAREHSSKNRYPDHLPCEPHSQPHITLLHAVLHKVYDLFLHRLSVPADAEADRGGWIPLHQRQLHRRETIATSADVPCL